MEKKDLIKNILSSKKYKGISVDILNKEIISYQKSKNINDSNFSKDDLKKIFTIDKIYNYIKKLGSHRNISYITV